MKTPEGWNGCNNCKWLRKGTKQGYSCKAFPDGVPMIYLSGEPHLEPVPGQAGDTVWEPK